MDLVNGEHDFQASAASVYAYYTAAAPSASGDSVFSDLPEISGTAAVGGYVAGGYDVQNDTAEISGGVAKMTAVDVAFTATAGGIGPFRYVPIYNKSNGSRLIAYWDYGSDLSLSEGESFTVDFGTAVFSLT